MGVCCGRQAEVEGFEPDVMRVESASDLSNVLDDAARLYGGVFQWCALIRVSDGQVLHREEHGGAKGNDARNGEEGMMTFMAFVASAVKPTHGGGRAATSVHVKDDTLLTAVHILGTVALITVISFEQDPASLAALDATEVAKTVHQLLAPVVESHLSSCRHEADPEAKEALAESLQELERKKAAVQRCAGKIGTSSDSPQVREKLKQATDDAKKCATQCTTDLRALKRAGRAPGSDGAVVSRMEETVVKAISDFKKASQDAARQEQAANNAERSHAHEDEDDHDEGAGLLTGQQTFQRRAVEVQYNDEIAAMRQGEIEDIEQTVVEIHDIFRDLDQIVNDGTEQLEQIEENVGRGADAVVEGNKQLRQANKHADRSRRFKCYLLLFAMAALLIIVLWATAH